MISPEEIEKLALLSRIEISEEEKKQLGSEIESIVGYVSEIQHVAGETAISAKEAQMVFNIMREDKDPHESGAFSLVLLAEAPSREGDYVRVKKIL